MPLISASCTLQGLYQDRPKLPFVPGSEVSGTVVEVGRDVRTVQVGDAVRPCPRPSWTSYPMVRARGGLQSALGAGRQAVRPCS
jgi:NADPH:quinone reductase-like Zn-dependent oxidoreductase